MTTQGDSGEDMMPVQYRFKDMYDVDIDEGQAKKFVGYEKEKASGASKDVFSFWEELDYEEVTFKAFLTAQQFNHYLAGKPARIRAAEDLLREEDQQYLPHLPAAEASLLYCRKNIIPAIHKHLMMVPFLFYLEKEKILFLQSLYKKFLLKARKQVLIEHFRHSKTLQPTLLKLALLRHEEMSLLPDYFSFKKEMDAATIGVADWLYKFLQEVPIEKLTGIVEAINTFKNFNKNNAAKHAGSLSGWQVPNTPTQDWEALMFIFLFKKEGYGQP